MNTPTKSNAYIGHLMVLATILIYSFNTNFMKLLIPAWIAPEGLVVLRCGVSALCFWIIGLFMPSSQPTKPSKKEILMIMTGGALGMAGNLLFYIKGLSLTGPVDAFIIRTVQPIIVIALSVLFLHAVFNRYKAIGIILGLAGTLYVSIMPHAGVVKDSFSGDVMILISSIFNGLFLVLIKPYTQKFNSVFVMKWMSLAALIITIPFGLKELLHAPIFIGGDPSPRVWWELAYTLIAATMIAYFLGIEALNYISAFAESTYIYLLPITGAIVSIGLGLQQFSWHDPIALVLIVVGFMLINKKTKYDTVCGKTEKPKSSPPTLLH